MTDLNPADYKNGEKISLVEGESVTSSSSKVTLGPAKAIASAIAAALVAGLVVLGGALTDNVVTPAEWIAVAIAVLGSPIFVGGAAYLTPTKVTGG